jgi:uncharacterized protein
MPELASEALRSGAERFDRGDYFEAHEVWEDRWRGAVDPLERLLLQGLIQVAAGYYKYFVQGKPASAARLLARGLAKLDGCPDEVGGLDLVGFRGRTRARQGLLARGELAANDVPALRG